MSSADTYPSPSPAQFTHPGPLNRQPMVLNDNQTNRRDELLAQIASNDYFAMLATHLDQISENLEEHHNNSYIELEKLISDLLYLHHNYKIVKR